MVQTYIDKLKKQSTTTKAPTPYSVTAPFPASPGFRVTPEAPSGPTSGSTTAPTQNLSASQIQQLLNNGLIDPQEAVRRLVSLGYSLDDAKALVQLALPDSTEPTANLSVSQVQSLLNKGQLTPEQATSKLQTLGYTDADAAALVTQAAPPPPPFFVREDTPPQPGQEPFFQRAPSASTQTAPATTSQPRTTSTSGGGGTYRGPDGTIYAPNGGTYNGQPTYSMNGYGSITQSDMFDRLNADAPNTGGGGGGGGGSASQGNVSTSTSNTVRNDITYVNVPTPQQFLDDFKNGFSTHIKNLRESGMLGSTAALWLVDNIDMFWGEYLGKLGQMAQAGQEVFKPVNLGTYPTGSSVTQSQSQSSPGGAEGTSSSTSTSTSSGQEQLVARPAPGYVHTLSPLDFLQGGFDSKSLEVIYEGRRGARAAQSRVGGSTSVRRV